MLLKKSGITDYEFSMLLDMILKKVAIVRADDIKKYFQEAENMTKDIDPGDAIFFACVLAYPDSVIWSEDKRLKIRNSIMIINTAEMMRLL